MQLSIELVAAATVVMAVLACWMYWRHLCKSNHRIDTYALERKALLTGNEIDFLRRLERAVGSDFRVMAQVSMGAVMETTLAPSHPDYWPLRESFAAKIIDFVICDPKTFRPLLVVELDDKMHDFSKDKSRDALVARCGLSTVRFWSRNKPDVASIRKLLYERLGKATLK